MKIYLKKEFLELVRQGLKDLEIRVANGQVEHLQPGKSLVLACRKYEVLVQVVAIRHYPSFEIMLAHENVRRIAPGYTKEQILDGLYQIYPEEREVIVIEIAFL